MATRVNQGLAPGIPGLSDGPGLSQTPGLWNQFQGLSGDTSGSTPSTAGSPIGLLMALTKAS